MFYFYFIIFFYFLLLLLLLFLLYILLNSLFSVHVQRFYAALAPVVPVKI